ncbi:MAG: hypothetical protein ABR951_11400 [Candidatus Aminicenantales bacterium]
MPRNLSADIKRERDLPRREARKEAYRLYNRKERIFRYPYGMEDKADADGYPKFPRLYKLLATECRIAKDRSRNPRTRAISEKWMAAKLGCSERTVRRMIAYGEEEMWLLPIRKSFDSRKGTKFASQYIVIARR